jgi:hypothetical protein
MLRWYLRTIAVMLSNFCGSLHVNEEGSKSERHTRCSAAQHGVPADRFARKIVLF